VSACESRRGWQVIKVLCGMIQWVAERKLPVPEQQRRGPRQMHAGWLTFSAALSRAESLILAKRSSRLALPDGDSAPLPPPLPPPLASASEGLAVSAV
jgi:hypothetical protein